MFDKNEMLVTVAMAEEKIKGIKTETIKEIDRISSEYVHTINMMKDCSLIKGVARLRNMEYFIGEPTPFYVDGIHLFTGDEVEFRTGKKGIIVGFGNGEYMIYTNAETAKLVTDERFRELLTAFSMFEGVVTTQHIKITKHFNTFGDGEEVARGRKGAEGFIIELRV
jgi:hypothetical protein